MATDNVVVGDEDVLWRRIPPQFWVRDENRGEDRPSSQAFQVPRDGTGISVDLARLRTTPAETIDGHPGYGVISLRVGVPRGLGLDVIHCPLRVNPAHAEIRGAITKAVSRRLAAASEVVLRGN